MNKEFGTMIRLRDSDQTLADPDQDIRGRKVVDRDGDEIGKVDDLLIDTELKKVRLLRIEHGGLLGIGATSLFIPVEAVGRVDDDEVVIDRSGTQVAEAPPYDPELVQENEYLNDLYDYYGYSPYWVAGYVPSSRGYFG